MTTLRAANPTIDEGMAFARYLDQAAEGFFAFLLGKRSADIIAWAYTKPGHDLSYQHATFAERDGVIVGMACGYTAEEHRRSSDEPLKQAAGRSVLRLAITSTLCAPLLRILDSIPNGDFYLLAIACDQECRGQGIGSALIDSIEERARATGSARLSLHVAGNNDGARRLYERRGMTVESQWPKRLYIPGLRFYMMAKAL